MTGDGISRPSSLKGKKRDSDTPSSLTLLDLPADIMSQIASYLTLPELIPFLSLHSALLSLTQTHVTPLRPVIFALVRDGPPYPTALAVLPSLSRFISPTDDGRLFLDVLVRAPPKWLLERFELGRWRDPLWQEAFERRFLPSWKRYKGVNDTWRAAFLRVLGRLEHRSVGCAHHESWTRFITLRRNGSATINRIYTRMFDPYEIFDELKHQSNLSSHPTQVRVVVHLQDVRVIALGVLVETTSFFVNPNAHLVLHPPLLRNLAGPIPTKPAISHATSKPLDVVRNRAPTSSSNVDGYFPLTRTLSPTSPFTSTLTPSTSAPSTSVGLSDAPLPSPSIVMVSPSSSPSFRSAIANWIPGRHRRLSSTDSSGVGFGVGGGGSSGGDGGSSLATATTDGITRLTTVRSREREERRRSWSLSRRTSATATAVPRPLDSPDGLPTPLSPRAARPPTPLMPTLPEDHTVVPDLPAPAPPSPMSSHNSTEQAARAPPLPLPPSKPVKQPYTPLTHPTPAFSCAAYPNFTPSETSPGSSAPTLNHSHRHGRGGQSGENGQSSLPTAGGGDADGGDGAGAGAWAPYARDLRGDHFEMEDDITAAWTSSESVWGGDGTRMTEWDEDAGVRRRWVGPMIIIAQLFPSTRAEAVPAGAPPDASVEGSTPDLGPRGMYASLGWEDLDALCPWVELRSTGAFHSEARRSGMGFEPGVEV